MTVELHKLCLTFRSWALKFKHVCREEVLIVKMVLQTGRPQTCVMDVIIKRYVQSEIRLLVL